jgi:hypothetical protein
MAQSSLVERGLTPRGGVAQGSVLAPYLFKIYLEAVFLGQSALAIKY